MTDKRTVPVYFNEKSLNKKLSNLNQSADCIQTVSLWIIHHRTHHDKIVRCWFEHMKKATVDQRLTLLYLANDIIQNCKRKNAQIFHEQFKEYIEKSLPFLMRSQSIRPQVERTFSIWKERFVYPPIVVDQWIKTVQAGNGNSSNGISKVVENFQPAELCSLLRSCAERDLHFTAEQSALATMELSDPTEKLKDRSQGDYYQSEIQSVRLKCQKLVSLLKQQLDTRKVLIDALEDSSIFYEAQYSDAMIVTTAYKTFGSKISDLKHKLTELKDLLPQSHGKKRKQDFDTSDLTKNEVNDPLSGYERSSDNHGSTKRDSYMDHVGFFYASSASLSSSYNPMEDGFSKTPYPALSTTVEVPQNGMVSSPIAAVSRNNNNNNHHNGELEVGSSSQVFIPPLTHASSSQPLTSFPAHISPTTSFDHSVYDIDCRQFAIPPPVHFPAVSESSFTNFRPNSCNDHLSQQWHQPTRMSSRDASPLVATDTFNMQVGSFVNYFHRPSEDYFDYDGHKQ